MPLSVCEVHRSAQSDSRKQQSFQGSKQDPEGLVKQLTNSVGIPANFTFSAASDHRQQLHAYAALLPDVSRNRTCQLAWHMPDAHVRRPPLGIFTKQQYLFQQHLLMSLQSH